MMASISSETNGEDSCGGMRKKKSLVKKAVV